MANEKPLSVLGKPDLSEFQDKDDRRLARKMRESPFMVAGLTGCVLACAYGAYRFKRRGQLSISNYLMQLRVVAQGAVIGTLSVGVAYSLFKRFTGKPE